MRIHFPSIAISILICLLTLSTSAWPQNKQFDPESLKESDLLLPATPYYYTWVEQRKGESPDYYVAITTSASPIAVLTWHFRNAKSIIFLHEIINHWNSPFGTIVCTNPSKTAKAVCKKAKTEYIAILNDFKKCDQANFERNITHCSEMEGKHGRRFPWITDLQKIGFIQVEPKQKQSSTPSN